MASPNRGRFFDSISEYSREMYAEWNSSYSSAIPIAPPPCSAVAETPETYPLSETGTVSRLTGSLTVSTIASPMP